MEKLGITSVKIDFVSIIPSNKILYRTGVENQYHLFQTCNQLFQLQLNKQTLALSVFQFNENAA